MELNQVKRVAASVLKVGVSRVKIVDMEKSQQAMTKDDIRGLIKQGAIVRKRKIGISRIRARKILLQKKKGKRKGPGKRKGTTKARVGKKTLWMRSVRAQRKLLKEMKEGLKKGVYRKVYKMISGGHFTSKDHLCRYIKEKELFEKSVKGKKGRKSIKSSKKRNK